MLTYAVGDIHGCLDLLLDLLGRIETDAAGRRYRLVFIGDYIDRGPDSAGVISTLRRLQDERPGDVICLKGNHEDLFLRSFARPEVLRNWLYNGGDAMLESYGADGLESVPEEVTAWVATCPVSFEDDLRCFVHAGLRPGRSLAEQSDYDRIWIRDEFLIGDHDFGKYVVHGHTPRQDGLPELRRYRLNLDTAAVYGGRLTAARFDDRQAPPDAFIQVER
jgi:serine/threonine protein phosphatase 1